MSVSNLRVCVASLPVLSAASVVQSPREISFRITTRLERCLHDEEDTMDQTVCAMSVVSSARGAYCYTAVRFKNVGVFHFFRNSLDIIFHLETLGGPSLTFHHRMRGSACRQAHLQHLHAPTSGQARTTTDSSLSRCTTATRQIPHI